MNRLEIISEYALPIVLGLVVCLGVILRFFLRARRQLLKLKSTYEQRELQRQKYCQELGHDLDASCTCRRCLATYHDPEVLTREEVYVEDDPGALWLDSNFQPDGHYEYHSTYRCRKCHLEWAD